MLRHRFSVRYDQRVELDNIPLGKGITGAAAATAGNRARRRHAGGPALHRLPSRHPLGSRRAAGGPGPRDRRDGSGKRATSAYFTEDHVRTLSLLAPQIASSVENARLYEELATRERRMEQDLSAARELQIGPAAARGARDSGLEDRHRAPPGAARSAAICTISSSTGEHALIAFGDSSGKGAAAALYGALVSGLLRSMAPRRRGPALLMQTFNEALLERRVDAQLRDPAVAVVGRARRQFTMANAGSVPPLVCRGGEVRKLRVEGVPLGLLDGREYEEASFQAEAGRRDRAVLRRHRRISRTRPARITAAAGSTIAQAPRTPAAAQAVVEAFLSTWTASPRAAASPTTRL